MANISIQLPTLIQDVIVDSMPQYYLRPLFAPYPFVTHRRYNLAITQYQKEVKLSFKGLSLNRDTMDRVLWYLFSPTIHYQKLAVAFTLSGEYIQGDISMIRFQLKDYTFIGLPALNNYLFMIKTEKQSAEDYQKEATDRVKKLMKLFKQDLGKEFDPSQYFAGKKEFITKIPVNIRVGQSPFKFDRRQDDWFFSRLSHHEEFDGATEIEKIGHDLNARYPSELNRAYFQEELVDHLYTILFRKTNTSLAIVGPPGVGKSTAIQETLYRYLSNYYETRKGRAQRLWHIDPNRVISGMMIVGMWQKRLEAIIQYLQKPEERSKKGDKLIVTNPVALLRIGKSANNNMTLADVFKPYLEKRELQMIILATQEEWKVLQEQDRRFSDLFQLIRVQEPDSLTATKIILQQRKHLEFENGVSITIKAIHQLLDIQRNYLKNKPLPGSVMDLLKQIATKYRYGQVDAQEVREEFNAYSGLREQIFDTGTVIEDNEIDQIFARELVGQPKAVKALADVVNLLKAKLNNSNEPICSLLFVGPTGVGKTHAAKVLAQYLTGSEQHLIRFDMNEFIDEGAAQRLIGDYSNPEGQLTSEIRYRPFGILLLDEIEKAHAKVHDLLLQVLDAGRLTDSLGRTVDFSNIIIIMTSNLGAEEVNRQLGFGQKGAQDESIILRSIEAHFRPEFVNRIKKMVFFNPLQPDHILGIAQLQIRELLQRDGFVRRTTILNISQSALEYVAHRGFHARMGGRALKRQIERDLTSLSAEQLISSYSSNPILFDIDLKDGHLHPRINNLEFVQSIDDDWLPPLPKEGEGVKFYSKLLHRIEKLEQDINDLEKYLPPSQDPMIIIGEGQLDWQYYGFKTKVSETKELIQNMMLGFSDKYFIESPANPLRLKPAVKPRKDWSKGVRENFKDRLFQKEALQEISEAYQYATAQFDNLKSEFINNYLKVTFLLICGRGFLRRETERVTMHFESCITGLGEAETATLCRLYARLLSLLDIHYEMNEDKTKIHAEGYSLVDLFRAEEGIQLFYVAHQNPLPIRMWIEKDQRPISSTASYKVIRIFDGSNTMTDLRSGFSNAVNITPEEFKLLIYAGLSLELKEIV